MSISPGRPFLTRRRRIASVLGAVGGMGIIAGMWLPLANLGGLGPVGFFDYNRVRAYAYIVVAAAAIVFSLARCFRIALLAAGGLCGLLAATGMDLYQAFHEASSMEGTEIAQMAHQMMAHSTLGSGACVLPVCVAACVAASLIGSAPERISGSYQ